MNIQKAAWFSPETSQQGSSQMVLIQGEIFQIVCKEQRAWECKGAVKEWFLHGAIGSNQDPQGKWRQEILG